MLRRGGSALEAVEAAVSALEDDDAFDAGRNQGLETCILKKLFCTDKKENQIFLIYKEIQSGVVAKSYMTNSLLICGEIFAHFLIY